MEIIYLYAFIAGFSLVLGAVVGLIFLKINQKIIAAFMAFGSGILISALTFGLVSESLDHSNLTNVIYGFIAGGLIFLLGDYILHLLGGKTHKKKHSFLDVSEVKTSGKAIFFGSVLDNIPESIALGFALANNSTIGLALLVAIFLSNFPEAVSSVSGLIREGFSNKKIIFNWLLAAVISFIAAILSYFLLADVSLAAVGFLEALAAGAILAMLANNMMPEAYEKGGFSTGLLTIVGFLLAFILTKI